MSSEKYNDHLLLSAIAAALRKEGDRHCQKNLRLVPRADDSSHTMPGNVFSNASGRTLKVHRDYFKHAMSVTIYLY